MGIAEDPRDGRTRPESGKTIRIPQPTRAWRSWHATIIVDSRVPAATFPTAARAGAVTLSPLFSPTHFHEEPEERRPPPDLPQSTTLDNSPLDRAEYLSDSRRIWRRGCVHGWFGSDRPLYVLVHPEWWEGGEARTRNGTIERLVGARHTEIARLMAAYGDEMDAGER